MAEGYKVVIVPGNGCTPIRTANWYAWLHNQLQTEGIQASMEDMPDPFQAKEKIWLPFMKNTLGADENSIIVGHSSGAEAAMRYIENNRVLGVVLVAACITDLGEESEAISGYYNRPWEWAKMKSNVQFIGHFQDRSDPFIPFEDEGMVVHKSLDTELFSPDRGDHFMTQEFPELLDYIRKMVQKHCQK